MIRCKHQWLQSLIDACGDPPDTGVQPSNRLSSASFRCQIENRQDGSIKLLIYSYIGDKEEGLDAASVVRALDADPDKPVDVRINSPGGLAFDGIAIYGALVNHQGPVTVNIEGIAASAAAVIAMAGQTVRMVANGMLFIHRAMSIAVGNQNDMLDMAERLDKVDMGLAETFAAKSGQTPERMTELMNGKVDGTSFTAKEALELGLIDEIVPVRPEKEGAKPSNEKKGEFKAEANPERQVVAAQAETLQVEAVAMLVARQRQFELEASEEFQNSH